VRHGDGKMNFINKYNEKIIKSTKVGVIEILFGDEGTAVFSFGVYEIKNNSVKPKEEIHAEKDLDVLLTKIKDKSLPFVLCVDGKGILSRKLNIAVEDLDETAPSRIIPNANAEDFYFEGIPVSETSSIVTIMRRSVIDETLEKIKAKGIFITELHLGPLVIGTLSSVLIESSDTKEIEFRNYRLILGRDGLLEVQNKSSVPGPESQVLAREESGEFKDDKILLMAGTCSYFSGWANAVGKSFCSPVAESGEEFAEKKKFGFYAMAMVVFFLCTLLLNFFVFQHYHNRQQELESQIGWQENALKSYEELKTGMTEKMNFAMESGILSPDNLAWMGDQLASTVPAEIKLTRMNVFPLEKKMENGDEHTSFNKHIISVRGQTASGSAINAWIKEIKQKEFVGEVLLTNYKQDDENLKGQFNLEIRLK
jgi:hypothetical protein